MKTLFIYYSRSGNGDCVAEAFAARGAAVRKVTPVKELPVSLFPCMMKGGFLATIGYKAKLRDFDTSLEGFDHVVIGSPVWNGRLSCPINTVLATLDLSGVKVDFVLYAGGGSAPKAEKRLKKEYPNAKVVVLKEPKRYPSEPEKADQLF